MKELNIRQMEEIEGGDFSWSGCGNALLNYGGIPVTSIGLGLALAGGLCVAGGLGWL